MDIASATTLFEALASQKHLLILRLLLKGEVVAGDLMEPVGPVAASRHPARGQVGRHTARAAEHLLRLPLGSGAVGAGCCRAGGNAMKGWIIKTRALAVKNEQEPSLYFAGGIPLPFGPSVCLSPERLNAHVFVRRDAVDAIIADKGDLWDVEEIEAGLVPPSQDNNQGRPN